MLEKSVKSFGVGRLGPLQAASVTRENIHHTSEMSRKRKFRDGSTAAPRDANTRKTEYQVKSTTHKTVNRKAAIAQSRTNTQSGLLEQPASREEDMNPSASAVKRKKGKVRKKKKKQTPGSASKVSLSTFPTEVLQSIVDFVKGSDRATSRNPSVTKDVRQLLRLIDGNQSLATSIKDVRYYEIHPVVMQRAEYSLEELKHDHKIYSEFAQELDRKRSKGGTFDYSLSESSLPEMSMLYDSTCTPLLFSRLTYLRSMTFHGYVGGGYANLLTPWAKQIWGHMPLGSLEELRWQPLEEDYSYQQLRWSPGVGSITPKRKPPNNDWNVVSFLQFTPRLKQLNIIHDIFLARATPQTTPVLPSLTAIYIQCEQPEETSQCIFELLKCSPNLKSLKKFHFEPFKELELKKSLHLVRNSLEEIDIYGEFEGSYDISGCIGSFSEFPLLKKLAIDAAALLPLSSQSWPADFSLVKLLPSSIEVLHLNLFDTVILLSATKPVDSENPFRSPWHPVLFPAFYKLLEDVALGKEVGPLKKLKSIGIHCGAWRFSSIKISEEGTERLSAICRRLGIEWKWSGGKFKDT
ncbi:hypothetical protein BZA77DRAFT_298301 [Pyronema omphalodes]|nr:hypothetical protein BZA77DRAFT_298301 [Pyronema omphalodes]